MDLEKGKEVEVGNKEGFEGAWLVATVIRPSSVNKNVVLVEYHNLIDEEENVPLQGYVDLLHLRPIPPKQKTWIFLLDEEVDAFFNHGWWKGVITKILPDSNYSVYFKTTEEEIDFQYWELRTHREWVGGRWTSSQDQDMTVMEQNEGSGRSLNPAGSPALNIDKMIQPSPSEAVDNYWENIVFTTDEEPSANEAHSSSDHALTTQEMSSTSKASVFVRPCKKISEGEATDTTLSLKRCHALGTSKGTLKGQRNAMEAEHSEDISVPKPYVQCQNELHTVLPTQQMNDSLFDTEGAGVENPTENLRNRGCPRGSGRIQESGTSNSQSSGMSFQSKGPEKECTITEMRQMTNVQTECTQVPSYIVEEHQTLSTFPEKTNMPVVKDNGGTEDEIANNDLSRSKLLSPAMKELQTPLILEQSILPTDEDNNGNHDATNAHSSPMQLDEGSLLLEKESLPFIKSSVLWGSLESMEVFRLVPQCPHFRPLEKENEVLREGTALGKMFSFASLMESTCKAQFDEPRCAFENKLKALTDMEEYGFTVQPIQSRLEKMLSMKDSLSQLLDRSNIAKGKLSDAIHKLDEIDGSISQLNMELQELLTKKETRELKVAQLQKTKESIKEMMQKAKLDFERAIAAPWKSNPTM